MARKIIAVMILLVATGYLLSLCFMGMNRASDLTYIAGIFGIVVWVVFLPRMYKLLTWRRRKDGNKKSKKRKPVGTAIGT